MTSWLPSEQAWLDDLTFRLLGGDILLVRSIPRWGLSSAARAIALNLGDTAVLIDGRAITEQNQKEARERIDSEIRRKFDENGYAQLVFDDYGRAIRRSQGGTLHSMLYRLLVDSEPARDTGALLVARTSDVLDLNFSGSPLISRAQTVVLPTVAEPDATALGFKLSDLRDLAGDSTWLARRFMNVSERQGRINAIEHLSNDRRRIMQAIPPAATQVVVGASTGEGADSISRETLLCLGHFGDSGSFRPSTLVRESTLVDEVKLQSPGWPDTLQGSVARFADLLAGAEGAFWVDRYIFHNHAQRVRVFLDLVRRHTHTRLRLLVSDDRVRGGFGRQIARTLDGVENVQVRFMHYNDRRPLHDRHLVLPALRSGFVLPKGDVVVGAEPPGSAVAVPMPVLPFDYEAAWSRGAQVFPEQ